jgi:hypothetical protein
MPTGGRLNLAVPIAHVSRHGPRALHAPMTATKILWGQVLVVFLIVLAAVWGATQWVAWRLG